MKEYSHHYWNNKAKPPHSFINGFAPIDGFWCTKEAEIFYLGILSFYESPGDHRSIVAGLSTRSMLSVHRYTVVKPVARRLVTMNSCCLQKYLMITDNQFDIHRIQERMDALENLVKLCGHPCSEWLQLMVKKLHTQIREIRQHGEKKCRHIMRPEADYSPPIQWWYDRAHAYKSLFLSTSIWNQEIHG